MVIIRDDFMKATNTKFSSGDTVPRMTPHQYRTEFDMGNDSAWIDHQKKIRKAEKLRHLYESVSIEIVARWVEATKGMRGVRLMAARRCFMRGDVLSQKSLAVLKSAAVDTPARGNGG